MEIYELFRKTMPTTIRSEEAVKKALSDPDNHIITHKKNNITVGTAVINKNTIYLLCVDESFQNRGIGTFLLEESEKYIRKSGFNNAIIGAGKEYITPGVPMPQKPFFEKRGYIHSWGDACCYDMSQTLADFRYDAHKIGDSINGITYRWATPADQAEIMTCVKAAHENFIPYYADTKALILIAEKDDEIVGTLQVSIEIEGKGIGCVGCTTTKPSCQGQGIATTMVQLGTKHLKDVGLPTAFLGYTYTSIVKMYEKSGYKTSAEYFMASKVLGS
ncbi:MAG: GNAT family N-acetyltransferase [Defluviitaleaceae bacterium]|nr:GNAT family N-acetyltransferase [Defluviitaleaceae bacterium]